MAGQGLPKPKLPVLAPTGPQIRLHFARTHASRNSWQKSTSLSRLHSVQSLGPARRLYFWYFWFVGKQQTENLI